MPHSTGTGRVVHRLPTARKVPAAPPPAAVPARAFVPDGPDEVANLIERLLETSHRLEELTGGQIDSVADGGGRMTLLPRAQAELRQSEAQKEGRYRALLEAAPDAMVVVDQAGSIVLVNTQAEKQFGYSRDELLGQAVTNIIPDGFAERLIADDLRSTEDALAQVIGTGIELTARRKDGSEFPIEIMLSPLGSPEGILVTAAIRDISLRQAAEVAMRLSEERLSQLVNGVADHAIFMLDPNGIVMTWNDGAELIKGFTADEIIGQHFSRFYLAQDVADGKPDAELIRAVAEGRLEDEGWRIRKDGTRFWANVVITPLLGSDGAVRGFSKITRDVTERTASDARYRGLLEAAPDAMVVVDQGGDIVLLNVQAEKQFGYRRDELLGQPVTNIIPDGFAERLVADDLRSDEDALAQQIGTGIELIARRKDATEFPIEIMLSPLESAEGILVTAAIRDISVRQAAEARYRALLEAAPDAMVVVDQAGSIVLVNTQAEKQFGYSRDELLGQAVTNIIPDGFAERIIADDLRSAEDALAQVIGTGLELIARRKDGSEFPIEIMLSPLSSPEGILVTAAIRNITMRRTLSIEAAHFASHDGLTDLPNRVLLGDRIGQAIALAARNSRQVAVLFLDLDGFKHINDSLGHAVGDRLLQSVAARLLEQVRDSDTVSRQGGDEFVVLLAESEEWLDAATVAKRMIAAVGEVHRLGGHDLHITTSIGISVFPQDGHDAETLIKNADTAMYQAKENGRNGVQFFRSEMNVRAVERQSIEQSLRVALEREEFVLHYQPKVDLASGAVVGAEALIRWTHPTRGLVSPAEFIPIAEQSGLIVPIGRWVLREACRQMRAWRDAGMAVRNIAVNVSAVDLRDEGFLDHVLEVLDATGLEAEFLDLELTETVLMTHIDATAAILQRLRERGVQVSLDDFGTGYSSLSYLHRFPIDSLKIDQSFVGQISVESGGSAIVAAIINMARSLKLRVIAEGVETSAQLAFLRGLCCDEAQGYYFSRPVEGDLFADYVKRRAPSLLVAAPPLRSPPTMRQKFGWRASRPEEPKHG